MKKRVFLALMVCFLVSMLLATMVSAAPAPKVDVCHKDDMGNYIKINISENAFPAHIEHGDASPNEYVPGMAGYAFDENCVPYLLATETINVYGSGAVATSSFSTKVGVSYKLVANGTYKFGNWAGAGIADAKCSLRPALTTYSYHSNTEPTWVDGADMVYSVPYGTYGNFPNGLQVVFYAVGHTAPPNLLPLGWIEPCNSGNQYTASVMGDGSPLQFFIWDSGYGDNVGYIAVTIQELP